MLHVWDKFCREYNPGMDYSDPKQRLQHYNSCEDIKQERDDKNNRPIKIDDSVNHFRVKVKDIPKMTKKNIQGSFDTWDTFFTAKMELAGLDDLVSNNFVLPAEDDTTGYALF